RQLTHDAESQTSRHLSCPRPFPDPSADAATTLRLSLCPQEKANTPACLHLFPQLTAPIAPQTLPKEVSATRRRVCMPRYPGLAEENPVLTEAAGSAKAA